MRSRVLSPSSPAVLALREAQASRAVLLPGARSTPPARSSYQLPLQQLIHLRRIRHPARRLHHLPDEKSEDRLLAASILRDLLRVLGDHLVNDLLQRALVRDLRQSLSLDNLSGALGGGGHCHQYC